MPGRCAKGMVKVASVLVVDDDRNVAKLVSQILGFEGFDVDVANNGPDALTKLQQHPVDLMVLDLNMPEMDGRRVYRFAREDGYHGPVLILSAYGALEARREL